MMAFDSSPSDPEFAILFSLRPSALSEVKNPYLSRISPSTKAKCFCKSVRCPVLFWRRPHWSIAATRKFFVNQITASVRLRSCVRTLVAAWDVGAVPETAEATDNIVLRFNGSPEILGPDGDRRKKVDAQHFKPGGKYRGKLKIVYGEQSDKFSRLQALHGIHEYHGDVHGHRLADRR